MTADPLAFELTAADRIAATARASEQANTAYDDLPQWSQRHIAIVINRLGTHK